MLCIFHCSLPQGRPGIVSVVSTGGGGKEGEGVGGGGGEEGGGGPGPQPACEAAPEQPGHLPAGEGTGMHTVHYVHCCAVVYCALCICMYTAV